MTREYYVQLLSAADAARMIDSHPELIRRHVVPDAYYLTTSGKKQPLFEPAEIARFGQLMKNWKEGDGPTYLTLTAAAEVTGSDPATILGANGIDPVAWYARNGKEYPLYDQGRVMEWAFQRANA